MQANSQPACQNHMYTHVRLLQVGCGHVCSLATTHTGHLYVTSHLLVLLAAKRQQQCATRCARQSLRLAKSRLNAPSSYGLLVLLRNKAKCKKFIFCCLRVEHCEWLALLLAYRVRTCIEGAYAPVVSLSRVHRKMYSN